ncbi:MAG TPA: phosphotransferase [Actinophytocola sp.]|uniref:phosphotransferase n=1 Tax=Actinophytocola sp. TaxID=1872138 RepID=UPI002DBAC64C|nr:phosphotransferase [Actinophytocola sp.]HEU5475564.1 phosphotransferase [Actinophytocola sp.]
MSALIRPGVAAWLARDVDLARYLAARGIPVALPCTDPPAGPHRHGELALTFWRYVPHDPGAVPDTAEVARSLSAMHTALRGYPGELPADGPLGDIARSLDLLERRGSVHAAGLHRLRAAAIRLRAAVAELPTQPLHGDPHTGNVLATSDGPVWIDFEDTWRGPLAWDLASFADTPNGVSPALLDTYPEALPAGVAVCARLRELFAVCWRLVMAVRFPAAEPGAQAHLRAWLAA